MAIKLSGEKISPIFSYMEKADCERPYSLSYYYVSSIIRCLFDLPIHRLAFLNDIIFCYCESSGSAPEQELTELLEGFTFPLAGETKKEQIEQSES